MDSSNWLYDLFIEEALPALDRHSGGGDPDNPITVQSKTVTPTKSQKTVYPDTGYDYLSKVIVNPIPDKYTNILKFIDNTVLISAFESDSTYSDYPYRAVIPLNEVTTSFKPYVMFSDVDKSSGILSDIAVSYNGGIYIYASEIPESSVSITEIICIEE